MWMITEFRLTGLIFFWAASALVTTACAESDLSVPPGFAIEKIATGLDLAVWQNPFAERLESSLEVPDRHSYTEQDILNFI